MQTETAVNTKIIQPAIDNSIKKQVDFVDTYDPLYKVKKFFKLTGCALLIIGIIFCIVVVVKTIK